MARKKPASAVEPPRTINFDDAKALQLADVAARVGEIAASALVDAESKGIKTKPLKHFWLAPAQREFLLSLPGISKFIKSKLRNEQATFTVASVAGMTMEVAEALTEGEPQSQVAAILIARHLIDRLEEGIYGPLKPLGGRAKELLTKADSSMVYQFKITLLGSQPLIWRRIQVTDCTLDDLHEHIQTSMGWTNSHLHDFEIQGKRYGDPDLIDDGFADFRCIDSTRTKISKILPKTGKRFRFTYEYDFGDSWDHEVLFEGCPKMEPGQKYPLCVEGERACPPEDVGGIGGFYEFLEALADPKHEQHDDFMEWGGNFDPEKFDARRATREMKKGLPEWRE